jgi:hypothetical protein
MTRSKLAFALLASACAWNARSADELESLDEDFLSYLAEFEGDEDDWTIVEQRQAKTSASAKPSASPGKADKVSPKPTSTTTATKPATPENGSKP